MKNVMTRAWEIAKEGAAKFGGKAKEYFAVALKMAWAETKKPTVVTIELVSGSRKHRSWIAEIVGTHEKFKFDRQFVNNFRGIDLETDKVYTLEEGKIYDVNNVNSRYYATVRNGQLLELAEYEVSELIA
ncbi:hypothetical protein A0U40_14845 [[Bacillus] sp. KCTC 13219]|nr:hypothetical protein A0U40_14845 [[Bacillus] sp. KCTC 13219]